LGRKGQKETPSDQNFVHSERRRDGGARKTMELKEMGVWSLGTGGERSEWRHQFHKAGKGRTGTAERKVRGEQNCRDRRRRVYTLNGYWSGRHRRPADTPSPFTAWKRGTRHTGRGRGGSVDDGSVGGVCATKYFAEAGAQKREASPEAKGLNCWRGVQPALEERGRRQ